MPPPSAPPPDDPERTIPPFGGRPQRWASRINDFRLRDLWWLILDRWESHRSFRWLVALLGVVTLLAAATWIWFYPWWEKRTAVKVAREWLAAGQYRYAADAAQRAAKLSPASPEPWLVAAELAQIGGQAEQAVTYAREAAARAPDRPAVVLTWAANALRAGQIEECERALAALPADVAVASAEALRLRGEIARREGRLTTAQGYFESALRLTGSEPAGEIPLGLILLQSADAAVRQRGTTLLERWGPASVWGPAALRTLLEDALRRGEPGAITRRAEALFAHPKRTVGDTGLCLRAFALAAPARLAELLPGFERAHAASPQAAAQLLGWLNDAGRHADALRWSRTLPAAPLQRPPLAMLVAESFRGAGDWNGLQAWIAAQDWGRGQEFLRWTYGLASALQRNDAPRAEELRRTLRSHAQLDGIHGLFAASSLYSWGFTAEAIELWWQVAAQEGRPAIDALGSLARHYQSRREAEGQYRAFRRWYALKPKDRAISNNLAFFAFIAGREERLAEQIARENYSANPRDATLAATHAFILSQTGRAAEAMVVLKPFGEAATESPALAFARGFALAAIGRKDEARPLLTRLPPETLTAREEELIAATLKP